MKAALFGPDGVAFALISNSEQGVIFTASHYGAVWRPVAADVTDVDQVPNLADLPPLPALPETPLLS